MSWREYFIMNKKERRGMYILIALIVFLLAAKWGLRQYTLSLPSSFKPYTGAEVDSFLAGLQKKTDFDNLSRVDKFLVAKYDSLQLFTFNPNTVTSNQMVKLGLTEKQISTILNFREKGGFFADKSDFKKIYGLRPIQYQLLEEYIDIPAVASQIQSKQNVSFSEITAYKPDTINQQHLLKWGLNEKQANAYLKFRDNSGGFKSNTDIDKISIIPEEIRKELVSNAVISKTSKPVKKYIAVDINTADTSVLNALPGIGHTLSTRIVEYRQKLGGYVHRNQLLEVYGFSPQLFARLDTLILPVDANFPIRKIRINFVEFKELKHPYLTYDQVRSIIQYRSNHGMIRSAQKLKETKLLPDSVYTKITPYLSF